MKKITVWDILTIPLLLATFSLVIIFARIFINPQAAINPLPPPTMIPTVEIPTSTPTLKSLPPTWTPEHGKGAVATLEATRATLQPSQTPPPSATVPVLPTQTSTAASNPASANTATNLPQPTSTTLPTSEPASTSIPAATDPPAPTDEPGPPAPPTNTPTKTSTNIPQPTNTSQPAISSPSIVWKASHETADISEWQAHGDFLTQGKGAYYSMITSPVHNGNYAVSLTIDTEAYSSSGAYAAYLFYWDQLPNNAYYYSAWYYVPSGTQPQDWWNVWQWKSTYNGNTDYSVPMHVLDIRQRATGQLSLQLIYRPDIASKINYTQNIKYVPTDQWFHIEAYYKEGYNFNGQVIVWQDGTEIFNLSGVQTTEADNTVYWSINHYTDHILPNPSSIYIDDAAISTERLGPDYVLP